VLVVHWKLRDLSPSMKQVSARAIPETVTDAEQPLPHLAFFDALSGIDESDADWHPLTAGLLVLRLVDGWLAGDSHAPQALAYEIRGAREAVDAVHAGTPVRAILGGVIESIEQSPIRDVRPIAPRLMAYGRSLEYESKWVLAADVYRQVITHAHPAIEPDMSIDATMRLGFCLRTLGDFAHAELAYTQARHLATAVGDTAKTLHARVGDAKVALARGNLPVAESILTEVLERAQDSRIQYVRAIALHDRAMVAHARGQYEQAIRFGYEALQLTHSLRERDRVLLDLGMFFMDSNVFGAARDSFMVLTATAQEETVRWVATLNLMEIAVREGSQPVFELYRRQLVTAQLPATLSARYRYFVGMGYAAFDRPDVAIKELERSRDLAAEFGLNQQLFETETLLADVRRGSQPQRVTPVEVPQSVFDVADAMSDMREQLV
jgi:tetratricopeptide (TPR) repeat protein